MQERTADAVRLRLVEKAAVRDFVKSPGNVDGEEPDTTTTVERRDPLMLKSSEEVGGP